MKQNKTNELLLDRIRMGTYMPYYFKSECGNSDCNGGWDCHPDVMNNEVEALWYRNNANLQECCRWSLHDAFMIELKSHDNVRPTGRKSCKYGTGCYRKNVVHLMMYEHPGDR